MRISYVLFGLTLLVAYAASGPVVKREAESEDLSPLNEVRLITRNSEVSGCKPYPQERFPEASVYLVEADDDQAEDGDRADRDKRKIGVVKLGVSNGILNFIFGKLDSFIDSKTKALGALDEANKVKNEAYGIDAKHSATSKFISELVAAKIKAASGSIGPVINSASTLFSGAKSGLAGAFVSKLAPLSSIASGLSAAKHDDHHDDHHDAHHGDSGLGAQIGGSTAAILGNILSSKLGSLSSLSQNHGDNNHGHDSSGVHDAGINLGGFANLGAGEISTTTEDIPEFSRNRVSLDVPGAAFGTGFTLITNISKILSSVILNSARRTQTVLEVFKPFFRGAFTIKGLPSDDHNNHNHYSYH